MAASLLTSNISAVLFDMLRDLYFQRANSVTIESATRNIQIHHLADFEDFDAYWLFEQDMFVVEFKTIDCDQYYTITRTFSYLSEETGVDNSTDDYDRAMRGI